MKSLLLAILFILSSCGGIVQVAPSKTATVTNLEMLILFNTQCGISGERFLDRTYQLVPSIRWFWERLPAVGGAISDVKDCDNRANRVMYKFNAYAVGVVVIPNHALNVLVTTDRKIHLYDAGLDSFVSCKDVEILDLWM